MKIRSFTFYTAAMSLILMGVSANESSKEFDSPYQKELDSVVDGELDYLLWFSNQNGLHSPTVATGKSPKLSTEWSSGVRAAIGGQPSHWDIQLRYTYFATRSHDKSQANIEKILNSTPSTAGIFEVGERWVLHFNRLDWELGRKILIGHRFLLEPFFGFEGLDVSQRFDLRTNTAFLDLNTGLPATDIVTSKNRNSLLGIGPRAGFKADFHFGAGFGLYGNFGANILWGKFKIKQKYRQTDYFASSSPLVLVDQNHHLSESGAIFNADLEIGLDWRHHFPTSNLELLLKAGWEQH